MKSDLMISKERKSRLSIKLNLINGGPMGAMSGRVILVGERRRLILQAESERQGTHEQDHKEAKV